MEVILNKDIENLGKAGSVVKVKDGFARNFLIPRGLGIPSTPANLERIEQAKKKKELESEKVKKQWQDLKERLAGVSLTIPVLTHDDGKLYGSITAVEISESLKDEGFEVDKNIIEVGEQIKALGIYEIPIKLHPEVEAKVKIWVVKK